MKYYLYQIPFPLNSFQELFGPLSMTELEQDRYVRQIDGYLPSAQVAFIDEIFKANSAILNTLLTVINERLFDNGTERIRVPLICMVGASNELPESEELNALYDRFLVRKQVKQASAQGIQSILSIFSDPDNQGSYEEQDVDMLGSNTTVKMKSILTAGEVSGNYIRSYMTLHLQKEYATSRMQLPYVSTQFRD